MTRTAPILSLLLGVAMPFTAAAADLAPLEAGTFILGTHTASVYYTVEGTSYNIVTTIAPSHNAPGGPARFATSLLPGQKHTVAVGAFGTGAAPAAVLEVVRTGDTLSARSLPAQQRLASHQMR
jgi:hypothetical protein